MSDYGASQSVKAEGWAITAAFTGASLFSGGLAYGAGALQWILVVLGVLVFGGAIYLGRSVKPAGTGAS
jgi:hypothetical protein